MHHKQTPRIGQLGLQMYGHTCQSQGADGAQKGQLCGVLPQLGARHALEEGTAGHGQRLARSQAEHSHLRSTKVWFNTWHDRGADRGVQATAGTWENLAICAVPDMVLDCAECADTGEQGVCMDDRGGSRGLGFRCDSIPVMDQTILLSVLIQSREGCRRAEHQLQSNQASSLCCSRGPSSALAEAAESSQAVAQ